MNLQHCPYDSTPVEVEAYSGGSFLISCTCCGAAWEVHNTLVRRVAEPDWDAVRVVRAEREREREAAEHRAPERTA